MGHGCVRFKAPPISSALAVRGAPRMRPAGCLRARVSLSGSELRRSEQAENVAGGDLPVPDDSSCPGWAAIYNLPKYDVDTPSKAGGLMPKQSTHATSCFQDPDRPCGFTHSLLRPVRCFWDFCGCSISRLFSDRQRGSCRDNCVPWRGEETGARRPALTRSLILSGGSAYTLDRNCGETGLCCDHLILVSDKIFSRSIALRTSDHRARYPAIGPLRAVFIKDIEQHEFSSRTGSRFPSHVQPFSARRPCRSQYRRRFPSWKRHLGVPL